MRDDNVKKLLFVPLSDEMIYEHPELITGPIQAFSPPGPTGSAKAETPKRTVTVGRGGFSSSAARGISGIGQPRGRV